MWLSILLHLCAAAATTVACAVAFRILTFPPWAGVICGPCLYAAALAVTFIGEGAEDE